MNLTETLEQIDTRASHRFERRSPPTPLPHSLKTEYPSVVDPGLYTPGARPALVFIVAVDRDLAESLDERFSSMPSEVELHSLKSLASLKEHLDRVLPDLIIVDWTGINYASLASVASRDGAPIVVLDRSPDPERRTSALREGAFDYLPFDEAYLESVSAAFGRARKIPALQSELRETEARYAAILEASSDGIFVQQDGGLTYVNDRFASSLGYEAADLISRTSLAELAPGDERDLIREQLARVAVSSGAREIFDVNLVGLDGEPRAFEIACRAALMNGRRAVVGGARDVTAIRQLTREVEDHRRRAGHSERLRALGEVAAGVAHDFNNVLEVILGRIDLVRIRLEKGEEIEPHLAVIANAAEDAADILQRVHQFIRPGHERDWQEIDLPSLVRDAAAFVRTRVPTAAKLDLRIEDVPAVRGDPSQLREVLVNLLNNALDSIMPT
ncbi:MAG: PAS domain S-box protein, partial [Myxococcota bacterium]